jgi:hypothetical protein
MDAFGLLMAAAVHDYKHPGVNNSFLMAARNELALRYNDKSVLENFHVAEAFLAMRAPECDWMSGIALADRQALRHNMIQHVLAIDLTNGAKHMAVFMVVIVGVCFVECITHLDLDLSSEDCLAIANVALKCADVSHPARPLHVHQYWSDLISEEFHRQGDLEQLLGMPISPLCDRLNHNLPKSQLGFIQFVVRPCFAPFSKWAGTNEWLACLDANEQFWRGSSVPTGTGGHAASKQASGASAE